MSKQQVPLSSLIAAFAGALLLTACGGGGTTEEGKTVKVDGINITSTINKIDPYDLEVSGANNKVTIKAGNKVGHLQVEGLGHDVWIEKAVVIDSIRIEGANTTVHVPVGFKSKISKSGKNNEVKEEG